MTTSADTPPTLLVATDSFGDAALVKQLLDDEFSNVYTSTHPEKAVEEFELQQPAVLVLAFNTLEKSERYYLGLYRMGQAIHQHPHRTVILCNKEEVRRAYTLCRDGLFDDYILFWPMAHDAPRLLMSVHHGLRELAAMKNTGPSLGDFVLRSQQLADLEGLLDRQMQQGGQHIAEAGLAMERAEKDIGAALDGLSHKLANESRHDETMNRVTHVLTEAIERLKREDIRQQFQHAAESVRPLQQWTEDFRQEAAPLVESARQLDALAKLVHPVILVVDDSDFERNLTSNLLKSENYEVATAASGIEALGLLRKLKPDLILMDVMMPGMNGIETTRRLKSAPRLAGVPVIMVTGKSEQSVVKDSLRAGAADFIVKPFNRETLASKIRHALAARKPST